jgi:hypothetical protein
LGAVCQLCNRGIHLQNGAIQYIGNIKDVVESYSTSTAGKNEYISVRENDKSKAIIISASAKLVHEDNRKYLFIVEFVAKECIGDIQIGMGVNDKFGTRLTTLYSKFYNFKYKADHERNRIYCEVHDLALKTGSYSVSIYLGNGFEAFDYLHDAFYLDIESQDFFPTNIVPDDSQGALLVSQRWWGEDIN